MGEGILNFIYTLLRASLFHIRPDMKEYFSECLCKEDIPDWERRIIQIYIENEKVSDKSEVPMCQDTGLITIYVSPDLLAEKDISTLKGDIGIMLPTLNLRHSQVVSPLVHVNRGDDQEVFIKVVPWWRRRVGVQISGAGSELQGFVKTFYGSSSEDDIILALATEILRRFPKSCPPVTVGIGMGGTIADAVFLSKLALFRKIGDFHKDPVVSQFERKLYNYLLNHTDRGAQGIKGGKCGVAHISTEVSPSHIAGFHVAVSFQCYLTRSWYADV